MRGVARLALTRPAFWAGLLVGGGLTAAAVTLPQVNWRLAAPPVDERPLTIRQDAKGDGRFGSPRSGRRVHRGVDLVAEVGSPVRAIRSGTVVQVGSHRGFGNFIELDHRHDLRSLYAHLREVSVRSGQRVRQGMAIGTVGTTGNARSRWISPHLHLEVWRGGEPVDPHSLGLAVVLPSARPLPSLAGGSPASDDASGGE